jgi:membrane protein implicated in regulation of membrane protease activity
MKNPAIWRACVMLSLQVQTDCMKNTTRIAWLIAGTLLVARLAKAVIGYILWYGFDETTFWLPGRVFSFVPCLNGAALLAVSFAIVATCSTLLERRLASREGSRTKAATRD